MKQATLASLWGRMTEQSNRGAEPAARHETENNTIDASSSSALARSGSGLTQVPNNTDESEPIHLTPISDALRNVFGRLLRAYRRHKDLTTSREPMEFPRENAVADVPPAPSIAAPSIAVEWKKSTYTFILPLRVNEDECLSNLYRKLHYETMYSKATAEERRKLRELWKILVSFIHAQYQRLDLWKLESTCTALTGDSSCVYAAVFTVKLKQGMLKFGQTFRGVARIKEQKHAFAVQAMSLEQLYNMELDEWVAKIKALELPAMVFDADHDDYFRDVSLLLLGELFFACSYDCKTNTVGEHFMELPTDEIRAAVTKRSFQPNEIERMQNISGMPFLFSWATVASGLHNIKDATNSPFLQHWLQPLPANGGFVTANRAMVLTGDKFRGFTNAMEKGPRQILLETVVIPVLKKILQDVPVDPVTLEATWDDETASAVEDILNGVRGIHHSAYVYPEDEELGSAALPKLRQLLDDLEDDEMLSVEKNTLSKVDKYDPNWSKETIDPTSILEIIPENPGALRLKNTMAGKRMMETMSFFKMYSDKERFIVRLRAAQAFQVALDLMVASGNLDGSVADLHRKISRSFLMGAYRDSIETQVGQSQEHSTFHAARLHAMPKGYFVEHTSFGILCTIAKRLDICSHSFLLICNELGPDLYNVWLQIEGLMGHGMARHGSPIQHDPIRTCPGPPTIGTIAAQPCATPGERQFPNFIGVRTDRAIYDIFVCRECQRKVTLREKELLKANPTQNPKRLAKLLQQEEDHRRRNRLAPDDRIANNRHKASNRKETREALKARHNAARRKREADPNRPKKKQAVSFKRQKLTVKVLYPAFFQQLLSDAVDYFIQAYGQREVFSNHILSLFEILLRREWERLKKEMRNGFRYLVWDETFDRPKTYLVHAYHTAMAAHLDPPETTTVDGVKKTSLLWTVKNYESCKAMLEKTAQRLKDAELWEYVVGKVYNNQE